MTSTDDDEATARMAWLIHTIKLRDGRDYTGVVESGDMSLTGLEDMWRLGAEEDARPIKKAKKANSKSKGPTNGEGAEAKGAYARITPGAVDKPMKKRGPVAKVALWGTNALIPASPASPASPATNKRAAGSLPTPLVSKMARTSTSATPLKRTDSTTVVFGRPLQRPVYSSAKPTDLAPAHPQDTVDLTSLPFAPRWKEVATLARLMPATPKSVVAAVPAHTPKSVTPKSAPLKSSVVKVPVTGPTPKAKLLPGLQYTPARITGSRLPRQTKVQVPTSAQEVAVPSKTRKAFPIPPHTKTSCITPVALADDKNRLSKASCSASGRVDSDITYMEIEDSDLEESGPCLAMADTTTKAHKSKPKLNTFEPPETRPLVKSSGEYVVARIVASGSYDDNLPLQARNTRAPGSLCLFEDVSIEAWAAVCVEWKMTHPLTPAHIKWYKAQVTAWRGKFKDAAHAPIDAEVGFGVNTDTNIALSYSMIPHAYHCLNHDDLDKANWFQAVIIPKLVTAAAYSKHNRIGTQFPELFKPASIGLIAGALTMGYHVIMGYRATGVYTPENLSAVVQARVYHTYYVALESMSAAVPNRLVEIQLKIRNYAMASQGVVPIPPQVIDVAMSANWGQDSKPRATNPFVNPAFKMIKVEPVNRDVTLSLGVNEWEWEQLDKERSDDGLDSGVDVEDARDGGEVWEGCLGDGMDEGEGGNGVGGSTEDLSYGVLSVESNQFDDGGMRFKGSTEGFEGGMMDVGNGVEGFEGFEGGMEEFEGGVTGFEGFRGGVEGFEEIEGGVKGLEGGDGDDDMDMGDDGGGSDSDNDIRGSDEEEDSDNDQDTNEDD